MKATFGGIEDGISSMALCDGFHSRVEIRNYYSYIEGTEEKLKGKEGRGEGRGRKGS